MADIVFVIRLLIDSQSWQPAALHGDLGRRVISVANQVAVTEHRDPDEGPLGEEADRDRVALPKRDDDAEVDIRQNQKRARSAVPAFSESRRPIRTKAGISRTGKS